MAIFTIERVKAMGPMFGIEVEGPKGHDLVMPTDHVFAMLVRDGMFNFAMNHGFVGMTVDVRKMKGAPAGTTFLKCFGRPRREEVAGVAHPLLADMLKGVQ